MKQQPFDLVIVGAGIIGTFTAWYAGLQHPTWKIALIDQQLPGSGATLYSATLDFPYAHTPLRRTLTARSRKLYLELMHTLPGLPLSTIPFHGFTDHSKGSALLQQFVDDNARLCPDELPAIAHSFPGLNLPEGSTMISGVQARYATSKDFTSILATQVVKRGNCELLEGYAVENIRKDGDLFETTLGDGSSVFSERMILATGPWVNQQLFEPAPLAPSVRIKKVVAFHIFQQPRKEDPVLYFFDDEAFLLPRYESGYWLFSFRCDRWDVSPSDQLCIEAADKEKALPILDKYWPLVASSCKGGRVFCDGYTSNGDPVIENVGNIPNLVVATAGSGSGFRLAPGIAEQALALLQ